MIGTAPASASSRIFSRKGSSSPIRERMKSRTCSSVIILFASSFFPRRLFQSPPPGAKHSPCGCHADHKDAASLHDSACMGAEDLPFPGMENTAPFGIDAGSPAAILPRGCSLPLPGSPRSSHRPRLRQLPVSPENPAKLPRIPHRLSEASAPEAP